MSPTRSKPTHLRMTLRTTILSLLVLIIGALSAVLIVTASHYSTTNAKDLSGKLMDRISQHVVERTHQYLQPAATAAGLSRDLARDNVVRSTDWAQMELFFIQLLRVYPQLAMINFGDEQGNFLMVKRFPVDTKVKGHPVEGLPSAGQPVGQHPAGGAGEQGSPGAQEPWLDKEMPHVAAALGYIGEKLGRIPAERRPYLLPAGSLSTKVIRKDGTPFVLWKYRDTEGRLQRISVDPSDPYDPRTRPWYTQAKESGAQGWTGVYIFFTDKMPGVASATPVFDQTGELRGAVSVEIELHHLSEFLAKSRVEGQGRILLANGTGELVAYSDVSRLRKLDTSGGKETWVLQKLKDVPDDEVRASFAALMARESRLPITRQHQFEVSSGGRRWLAMYSPFPPEVGQPWTVGILVPEDLVLGRVERNRWMSILISLVTIFVALLLAVVLSKAISSPLGRLVEETERIRTLDLSGDRATRSSLSEIDRIVTSVHQMKVGLRSFVKYVPRDLVAELVASGTEATVQGEKREMSVLFSDIAGFTTISEGLDPGMLVAHLNGYFDATTNALLQHGATIDKYIGDAIMAFWGAPRRQADHAERACGAALGLCQVLDTLNLQWREEGLPEMHTRIGVHTGEAVVGNIGSDARLAYTIIGDTVNLASRIEGICKIYGTWVTISEVTYTRVRHRFVARALDLVAVKGRREGVRLYELRCVREGCPPQELELEALSESALDHYQARRWEEAIGAWEEIQRRLGTEDEASALMIRRARAYQTTPPDDDWVGVHRATTK